jgi:hypothetical protein
VLSSAVGALTAATVTLANVPDPGQGEAPPGMEGFLQLLSWTKWIALGICVLGLMVAGALMAVNARRGEGGEHLGRIGMALAGVVVISGAYFVVGALA